MWKPIEIKPGDQSLVGRFVIHKIWITGGNKIQILFLGESRFFGRSVEDRIECAYDYSLIDWLIWEPEASKKLVAPALIRRVTAYELERPIPPFGYWEITSHVFSSKEEATEKTNKEYQVVWPAIPKDGFYEVPE